MWVSLAAEQRAHGSHLLAAENRGQARDLVAQYVHADGVAVAVRGGLAVGFVMFHAETGLYETDATRGVVDNVYVRPDQRGDGLGSALLDFAEDALCEDGADVLAVEALAANDAARRLYERRGYQPHRVTYERPADPGTSGAGDTSTESDTHSKDDA
ncbi:GNAT family N-acetyltransferase [Halobacterium rubrum]|nr:MULTISPECIES: GNAT family N-acetyltransferase [Halobacterium]MDH5019977.1 GNAT family N-acetyltransferase [Halobacterium rubrum]